MNPVFKKPGLVQGKNKAPVPVLKILGSEHCSSLFSINCLIRKKYLNLWEYKPLRPYNYKLLV